MAVGASRIYHVNSNCTDLARSADFYEGLGLRRVLRTTPSTPQPGAALGLDQVAWDAWMMSSDDGTDGLVLDLLRWTTPPPTGAPPPTAARPGLDRLCLTTPALDAVLGAAVDRGGLFRMACSTDDCRRDEAVLRAAGCAPFAPTSPLSVGDDLPLLRVLFWPGPDGECLELIEVIDDDQTDHGREDW
jgi:catechol 2,3-dioxygenase-like lactoylglutathione lyase family enzyme